jgi:hypothetical protein
MTARDSVRNDQVIIILPTCSGLAATRVCLLAVTISTAQPARPQVPYGAHSHPLTPQAPWLRRTML